MDSDAKHGTGISWTHIPGYRGETWNATTGCSLVSSECANCYAEELSLRRGWSAKPWTPANAKENVVLHPERLDKPLHWREPRAVFVDSMSDLFHEQIPDEFLDRVFSTMMVADRHLFLILTKRPERMRDYVLSREANPLPNVWLGVSIGQRHFVRRADVLRETPAAMRFISAEPLIGPLVPSFFSGFGKAGEGVVTYSGYRWPDGKDHYGLNLTGIGWLLVGGESGPGYREMDLRWAYDLQDHCRYTGTTFFMKQDSGRRPGQRGRISDDLWVQDFPAVRREVGVQGTLL